TTDPQHRHVDATRVESPYSSSEDPAPAWQSCCYSETVNRHIHHNCEADVGNAIRFGTWSGEVLVCATCQGHNRTKESVVTDKDTQQISWRADPIAKGPLEVVADKSPPRGRYVYRKKCHDYGERRCRP